MAKKIYLAGPITGLSFDDADAWRKAAMTFLSENGIEGYSPLRGKAYLKSVDNISSDCEVERTIHILSEPRSILARDFYDATHCDVLLINFLGATQVSMGTIMELAWAYQRKTPIVCCMESSGNPHDGHAMVTQAIDFRVDDLQDGLDLCVSILNTGMK